MYKISFYLLFLSVFLASCNTDGFVEHELGNNLIDNSTDVRLIDTFTINASTVIVDSLATSGTSVITVGQYVDPYFGVVKATGFTKIGLGGGLTLEKSNDPVFDSIVLITYFDKKFYGDTLKTQTISVHRVTEEIKLNDNGKLYNVDDFAIDSEPLGEKTFEARPLRTKNGKKYNLRIKLSDDFGKKLIEMAEDHDDIMKSVNEWENFLEGISLRPGDNDDAAILNFKTSDTLFNIRLYYHEISGENSGKDLHHDFPAGASPFIFSNYKSDRTGTLLEDLVDREFDLPSEQTNNLTFMQGGIGLMTKIRIPHLNELSKIGKSGSLLSAELVFYPEPGTYSDELYPLPASFNLYVTDEENHLLLLLSNPTNNVPLTSQFRLDNEYQEGSYYSFDVTNYVNSRLSAGLDEDEGLLISLPTESLSSSTDRIVLTNDHKSDFEFKLRATYVVQK
ncbi:DUF4270 family protein [Ancylomarina longa]|uniref:DUF4270 family protein n=1 Tax=Ancylomarina longa TaxID=2487017 RepID=A0A434AW94_9BACT|nr:DUF4270 family protein [Ancylomarina longa]RUT78657.1 DUF4270 family protein [Ancylomarina longa]